MKNRAGFTLIECMLYVFILGVIMLLFFPSTMHIYAQMRSARHKNHILLSLYTAGDAFARDMRIHHPIDNQVHYRNNGVLWYYGQHSQAIGWFLVDTNLVRFEGTYNLRSATWSGHTKSIVCAVTGAQFTAAAAGAAVMVQFVSDGIEMERTIWL